MSEGTVVTIFALRDLGRIEVTKFSFVLIFMIQSLYSIVSSPTLFFFRTLFSFSKLAELRSVVIIVSSFVFDRMVVITAFVIVWLILFWAFDSFEIM